MIMRPSHGERGYEAIDSIKSQPSSIEYHPNGEDHCSDAPIIGTTASSHSKPTPDKSQDDECNIEYTQVLSTLVGCPHDRAPPWLEHHYSDKGPPQQADHGSASNQTSAPSFPRISCARGQVETVQDNRDGDHSHASSKSSVSPHQLDEVPRSKCSYTRY
jgi:hypothetical protein